MYMASFLQGDHVNFFRGAIALVRVVGIFRIGLSILFLCFMSDMAIAGENLRKKYIIGHQKQERCKFLGDAIADGAKSFWRSLSGGGAG